MSQPSGKRTNIEFKARCYDLDAIRKLILSRNPRIEGVDEQTDTYFSIDSGRLKLRRGNIENSLIHYTREDTFSVKESSVWLYRSADPNSLENVLLNALDVDVVVKKTREIYFIDNVKFHLDHVDGLGDFVEVEAIDRDGTIPTERLDEQCREYQAFFGIADSDMVAESYSDMIRRLQKAANL